MNRYRVAFRSEALEQLDELYDFIAEDNSPAIAAKFTDSIVAFCDELADFPFRGRSRDDLRPGLRILGYRRRVVIAFAVLGDSVVIVGIHYGGRDFEALLSAPIDERPKGTPGRFRGQLLIANDFDDFTEQDERDWYGN